MFLDSGAAIAAPFPTSSAYAEYISLIDGINLSLVISCNKIVTVRPFLFIPVYKLSKELHLFNRTALDFKQRFTIHAMVTCLIKGEDRKSVQHILRHHVFAEVGHIFHELEIIRLGFF